MSLFAVAPFEARPEPLVVDIRIPDLLSFLATNTLDGKVEGINDLSAQYQQKYGPGDYAPVDRRRPTGRSGS